MKKVLGLKIENEVAWYLFAVIITGWISGFIMTSSSFSSSIITTSYYIFLYSPFLVALFFLVYDTELLEKVVRNIFTVRTVIGSITGVMLIYILIILSYFFLYKINMIIPSPKFHNQYAELNLIVLAGLFVKVFTSSILPSLALGLGEEVGWRGFLQHKLSQRHTFPVTVSIVSVFWFLWHLPVILSRSNYQLEAIIFNSLTMLLLTVSLTVILGFFFRLTESVIVVALMHVANNAFQNSATGLFLVTTNLHVAKLLTYTTYVGFAAILIIVFFRKELKIPNIFKLKSKH